MSFAAILLLAVGLAMDVAAAAAAKGMALQRVEVRQVLLLSVATSIDALAAGITLPILGAPLVLSVVTIGVTTAFMSVAGLYAGQRFGALLGKRLDIAGGLILIALGVKILGEHEFFGRVAA